MNIEKMIFQVTKTTTYEIVISKDDGYDMPETAKELIDTVNSITNSPARELAWSSDNLIDDKMVIDSYEIKEGEL